MLTVNPDILPTIRLGVTLTRHTGWCHDYVTKECHVILLLHSGSITVRSEGRDYNLNKDDILLIPKLTPYSLLSHSDFHHTAIHFDADISSERESTYGCFSVPSATLADDGMRKDILLAASPSDSDPFEACLRRIALLSALLGMGKQRQSDKDSRLAKGISEYLAEHYSEPLELGAIAEKFGYSKQYVIRIYKRECGKTPMAALNEMRLSRGAEALLYTSLSVAEVAKSSGFDDYNYFSRLFKKTYGVSPRDYRRSHFVI